MVLALTILVLLVLTLGTLIVSRVGASRHQEDLNTGRDGGPPSHKVDRPADAGAEPMGVDGPGQPNIDPTRGDR